MEHYLNTGLIVLSVLLLFLLFLSYGKNTKKNNIMIENLTNTEESYPIGDISKSYFEGILNVGALSVTNLNILPPKSIVMWFDSPKAIPEGWALCDGVSRLNDGTVTPDLSDKFIKGRSNDGTPSTAASTKENVVFGGHLISGSKAVDITTKTEKDGSHSHIAAPTTTSFAASGCSGFTGRKFGLGISDSKIGTTGSTHSHQVRLTSAVDIKPIHAQLVFIMKK
jgi:hypothetical protein